MTPETPQGTLIGQFLGGYRLMSLLGAGGMAEVYRAQEPRLGREVAIKVLPRHLAQDAGYVNRFRFEAQRVAALTHPNVVPVFNYGEERGLLYIVMPLMKESLRDRMDREKTMDPSEAARLAVQVAAALDAAHQQGIVHRDVKPENIMLNAEGRAMLTDFGIARELDVLREASTARTLAATGLPVGTPEYMAPEQLRGVSADQRVDVYGLGAVLYEMLTGHVPHDADTPYEVAARVLTERALPPSEYNPAIWPELEEVVLGALTIDANDRYPDMRSFAGALRRGVLQRGAGTALVASDAITHAPTPLARSIASGRLVPVPVTGTLVPTASWSLPSERLSSGIRRSKPSRRRIILLTSVGAALAMVFFASVAVFAFNAFNGLGFGVGGGPAFVRGTATAGNGLTPNATGAAATDTATTQATATAGAIIGATATAHATSTPVPHPTATPTSVPPSLTVSPTTVHIVQHQKTCHSETIYIGDVGGGNVNWAWNWTPPTSGVGDWSYQVNTQSPQSSLPSGTVSSGQSESLVIYYNGQCSSSPTASHAATITGGGTTINMTVLFEAQSGGG